MAFTHVRAFLAGDHFAEEQTVVIDKGVHPLVGPTNGSLCPGAQIVDGKGRRSFGCGYAFQDDAMGGPCTNLAGCPRSKIRRQRQPGLTLARAARKAKGDLFSMQVYRLSADRWRRP